MFLTARPTRRHFKMTGKRFVCEKCGRDYASERNLKRHVMYECGITSSQYQCPYCSYCAKRPDLLHGHMQTHKIHSVPVSNRRFDLDDTISNDSFSSVEGISIFLTLISIRSNYLQINFIQNMEIFMRTTE